MDIVNKNRTILIAGLIVVALFGITIVGVISNMLGLSRGTAGGQDAQPSMDVDESVTLADLMDNVTYTTSELVKGAVSMGENSLYDELPEIDKYPAVVESRADVNIEIFSSGEKAGTGQDSWLVDCAREFNSAGNSLPNGKTVGMTVRSIGSGLGADYILSRKALPDLYTPSNPLFADYAIANGADMELYLDRLVGNTAGVLVRKNSGLTSADDVLVSVLDGGLNFGYTNPQNSAAGVNMLVYFLQENGGVDSDNAAAMLAEFNKNIPYVAYTTQQMATSAANGSLDAMVSEYQAYINDENLTSQYDFVPYGLRHDNPLYLVNPAGKTDDEILAIQMICDYLTGSECQNLAAEKGFNQLDDYQSVYSATGAETGRALQIYKKSKDAGRPVIAVFVADRSGSMRGNAMLELKESLTNGMQYVNEDNYVGLVSYSSKVSVDVPIGQFDLTQKAYFQGAVDRMEADGDTYTYEALCVAMDMIEKKKADIPDAKCMIFLLSDGWASGYYGFYDVAGVLDDLDIPVYTIAYTDTADTAELLLLSEVNEAVSVSAGSDDIIYHIKSLFNSQL